MRYIVMELQTNKDGTVGNLVYSYDTEDDARSKYHLILSAAAVSKLPMHAAVIIRSDGALMEAYCFEHEQEAE